MKRSEALKPLSRAHHKVLILAKAMIDNPGDPASAEDFRSFWSGPALGHFRREEEVLLPLYALGADEVDDAACSRMLLEHVRIRAAALRLTEGEIGSEEVRRMGSMLRDHVRYEERELFPLIEGALDEVQLGELGRALAEAA